MMPEPFESTPVGKVGYPPGSLVHVGEKKTEEIKITLIDYDESKFESKEVDDVEECFPFKDRPTITWINIDGLHRPEIVEKIGEHFDVHTLILEDILNTNQRPKIEDFEDYIFMVLKMLRYDEEEGEVKSEQISIILGSNFLISFQERVEDDFDPVRERIRGGKGRIRKMGADYLAYVLIDTIVDSYFKILEKFGEDIEDVQEELITDPAPQTLEEIHNLKRELISLRKSIWPLREVINSLRRGDSSMIEDSTKIYFGDVYDHTVQLIDMVETYREMVSSMLDVYLSSISNKMNEVMKVLTIIATIFIPLTFLAGIYGMNFAHMPELQWRWGYPAVLFGMIGICVSMLIYFRRRGWL